MHCLACCSLCALNIIITMHKSKEDILWHYNKPIFIEQLETLICDTQKGPEGENEHLP